MLSETLQNALNEQIKHEFDSAYIYLAMSTWMEASNWPGMSHWMRTQFHEEMEHGMRFLGFVEDRNGRVRLSEIAKPEEAFNSPLAAFEAALEHEQFITNRIYELHNMAVNEKDYASQAFLQSFATEQVEEEKTVSDVVARLKIAGDEKAALLFVDNELGQRQAGEGSVQSASG